MTQEIRTQEEIASSWGARLEQQYLSTNQPNNSGHLHESSGEYELQIPDLSSQVVQGNSVNEHSADYSHNGTNYSMPTRNLSDFDVSNDASSTATLRGFSEERACSDVEDDDDEAPLINLRPAIPGEVHNIGANGRSLSEKLTGDGPASALDVPTTQSIPSSSFPRPTAVIHLDRCVTPQRSNARGDAPRSLPSPGARTNSSEIFHYTYETDLWTPGSPVPPFIVVPSSGVARVTIRPTGSNNVTEYLREDIRSNNERLYKRACFYGLVSILVLAIITLISGIVKAREHAAAARNFQASVPTARVTVQPTVAPVIVMTPAPAPDTSSHLYPTPEPVFSIPNEDGAVNFPDLSGGVVAREETASPTTSGYTAPTTSPRTKRPTSAPSTPPAPIEGVTYPPFSPANEKETIVRAYLRALIDSLSPTSTMTLDDPLTPQHAAFEWIVSDQMATDPMLPDDRLVQRFVLATFFYSTSGMNWADSSLWLTLNNECDWYHTRIHGICDDFNGLIHTLEIEGNGISGVLPSELALIPLRRLFMRNNNIGGTIPTEIGALTMLEILQLTNNALIGSVPTEIGNLSNLVVLGIGRNQLEGTLPTELGMLKSLDTFGMEANSIKGPIPTEMGLMSDLRFVSMCSNSISGEVPSEIGMLLDLSVFRIADNDLWGSIPFEICSLRSGFLSQLIVDCDEVLCDDDCCSACRFEEDPPGCP